MIESLLLDFYRQFQHGQKVMIGAHLTLLSLYDNRENSSINENFV
jgi:hypothetical protein